MSELKRLGTGIKISPVYESRAYGFSGDNFYNLAVGLDTDLVPGVLTGKLRDIEDRHGRLRHLPRYSSRTLDLDLLLYGDMICHDANLDVPRRDIMSCAVVLKPLAEIAGELRHPEAGVLLREIWEAFERPGQDIWAVEFELQENQYGDKQV
jgi:2-amino-4-hydroxy-6-hydroxymethyldihydropteridine diphosphokinase